MLLVETALDCITEVLHSDGPIAYVPAESVDKAKQIAISARDGGFGVSVIVDRSRGWLVLVAGDAIHETELRSFVRRYDAEIATERQVEIDRAYCSAGWLTGLAHSQGADVGDHL